MPEALSNELQTRLMTAIGKRRSRTFSVAFAVAWPITGLVLLFGLGVGVVPNLIVSSALATVISKLWVKRQRDAIIRAEMAALSISPDVFDPTKFMLD